MESAREQHTVATMELNNTKQELTKLRQDFDAAMEAKVAALKHAEEAERAAKTNVEKARDLSKEISALQESIGIVKAAANVFAEKNVQKKNHEASLEASTRKLLDLKNETHPDITVKLEAQLAETVTEVGSLRKQVENVKASDLDSLKTVTSEMNAAKESLQKLAEEESSLQSLMGTFKAELENVKRELSEFMKKESETEFITRDLNVKLQKSKSELKACSEEEAKARDGYDDMVLSLHRLSLETENAKRESEEMLQKAEELKKEAESTRVVVEGYEKKLKVSLEEAEEAKTAEGKAVDQVNAAHASTSESGATITISKEEYESLTRKVAESDALAEVKVSAAMAEAETVKASESEALKKLEANLKEMEEMKATTECALRKADMSEAARMAVEGELRRWHEIEQRKAAEQKKAAELPKSPRCSSPHHYGVQKQRCPEKTEPARKLEKSKTSVSKKSLMRNFSGMFHKKKKNLSDGGTPSYLPEYNTTQTASYIPEHSAV